MSAPTITGLKGAFLRYRVLALIVGVLTPVVVLIATPLDLIWDQPSLARVIGPIHGFLFMAYLVVTFLLGVKLAWSWKTLGWRMAAGIIPFLTFVVERQVEREVKPLIQ